jgi:predicted phage tail protein
MALNSISVIKVVDALCEGPIEGIVDGTDGIYLEETPITSGGTSNFNASDVAYGFTPGTPTQQIPLGLGGASSTVTDVGVEIGKNYTEDTNSSDQVTSRDYGGGTLTRQITDTDVDSFQVLFTIPRLFSIAKEGLARGQAFSATVRLRIQVQSRGSAYNEVYNRTIKGVTLSNYQVITPIIQLSGEGPWNIKVIKDNLGESGFEIKYTDLKSENQNSPLASDRGNTVIWSSLVERQSLRLAYPYTSLVSLSLSTEQFGSLPSRAYKIRGKKVLIPHNAIVRDDGSLDFFDAFNGSLVGPAYTTCPVCCFYDMLTNSRYGAGDFVDANNLSWADLYPLSRYSNQLVTNGDGTVEPRFACNVVISDQAQAYNVLQDLASVFRGQLYWSANTIQAGADHGNLDGSDVAPVHIYSNSNVVDGAFNYSGSSLKTRATSVRVRYNDPDNFYKTNVVVVEDSALIAKYGYQVREIVGFACTSKYQAQRVGQWMLKVDELNGETVSFGTGLQGAVVLPGQIFAVADQLRAGVRLSGRIASATTTAVVADQSITLPAGSSHELTCLLPDGTVETKAISSVSGSTINVSSAFSAAPQAQAIWSISSTNVNEQKFRCISVADNGDGTFTISGVVHNDSLYAAVEEGKDLEFLDVTTFDQAPGSPDQLQASATQINNGINLINRVTVTWSRSAIGATDTYEFEYQVAGGAWVKVTQANTDYYIDGAPDNSVINIRVRAVGLSPAFKKSNYSELSFLVPTPVIIPPPDPTNVALEINGTQAILTWNVPGTYANSGLVAIIRHSTKTDGTGTWQDSTLLSSSISADTTQAILPLIEGEYLIKFEDQLGLRSVNATSAVVSLPDAIPTLQITTVREDQTTPPFQGQVSDAFYSDEFDGLVLSGNQFFDSVVDVDALSSFDFTGDLLTSGRYYFANIVDLNAKYNVVFDRILTTRGIYANDLVDQRVAFIDSWSDFDGQLADDTSAEIYFRVSDVATAQANFLLEDGDSLLLEDGSYTELESDIDFGAWTPLRSGRYTGRQFQFKCELTSADAAETPIVDELGFVMKMEGRTERSATIASGAGAKVVTYTNAFYEEPSLGLTAFNLATGDYYLITSASRTGFTVTFYNSSNVAVDRNFQYVAAGYGTEVV